LAYSFGRKKIGTNSTGLGAFFGFEVFEIQEEIRHVVGKVRNPLSVLEDVWYQCYSNNTCPMDYSSLQPEELTRICAEEGQAPEWHEFIHRFHPLISSVVVRVAAAWGEATPSVLDDIVQETYLKLCANNRRLLRTFQARQPGAIYGFLKVVTANVVHDHFKTARAVKRGSGKTTEDIESIRANVSQTTAKTEVDQRTIERTILVQQIDRHLRRTIPPEDLRRNRLIFWLYYRHGLTANAIASVPGVGLTPKGVESLLLRLTRMVRAHIANPGDDPDDEKGILPMESF
jgi:RNA polymerase sigma-70 factor (ECF subfamily)